MHYVFKVTQCHLCIVIKGQAMATPVTSGEIRLPQMPSSSEKEPCRLAKHCNVVCLFHFMCTANISSKTQCSAKQSNFSSFVGLYLEKRWDIYSYLKQQCLVLGCTQSLEKSICTIVKFFCKTGCTTSCSLLICLVIIV